MITDYFQVELGGIGFRLAESVEGDHYQEHGDPLRPQTFAVVGGATSGDLFQMRPDTLLWSWTDWGGGEGQFKYTRDAPNRYWKGNCIDPFEVPGTLRVGPAVEETYLTGGPAAPLGRAVTFVRAMGNLYAIDEESPNVYEWDDTNDEWKAAVNNALGTAGKGATMAAGDTENLWYKELDANTIFKWDGTTFTLWNNDTYNTPVIVNRGDMVVFGNYIYLWQPANCRLWEIPKTGTAPVDSTLLYDLSDESGTITNNGKATLAIGDNRIYIMQLKEGDTHIHEVIPTTAAGTGYGRAIARIPGFKGEAILFHMGFLYIIGKNVEDSVQTDYEKHILYLQPGGEFGSLGEFRNDESVNRFALMDDSTQSMLLAHFVQYVNDYTDPLLFAIEAVAGGYACISKYNYAGNDYGPHYSLGQYKGDIFWSSNRDANTNEVWRTLRDSYYAAGATDSFAISPVWDFGLVDDKIAQSVRLTCDPLPADWTIHLDYQDDQDGSWTNAGSYSTTSGTGISYAISTDTTTVTFRNIQMRVRFQYTGAGTPTTTPVLHSVELRAMVSKKIKGWDIMIELSDEGGQAQNRAWDGAKLISQLRTLCTSDSVLDFKNGYGSYRPNSYTQHDVVIDQWLINITRPGEGYAWLRLLEVT